MYIIKKLTDEQQHYYGTSKFDVASLLSQPREPVITSLCMFLVTTLLLNNNDLLPTFLQIEILPQYYTVVQKGMTSSNIMQLSKNLEIGIIPKNGWVLYKR